MSTRTPTQTTRSEITSDETNEAEATREAGGAPLTFATENEVPIRGLFDSEADQH